MSLFIVLLIFLVVLTSSNLGPVAGKAANPAIYSITDYYQANPEDPEKAIALTFDDGPHQLLTPKLLDILKEKTCKATFFVMGVKVNQHVHILKRAIAEGHEIANHVWDHPVISKLTFNKLEYQLKRTQDAIFNSTGYRTKVMRPPYGNTYPKMNQQVTSGLNHSVIMWSYDTQDWRFPPPNELVSNARAKVQTGDIILCHDIFPGTIEAMPSLLDSFLQSGYKLVTVSKLLTKVTSSSYLLNDSMGLPQPKKNRKHRSSSKEKAVTLGDETSA